MFVKIICLACVASLVAGVAIEQTKIKQQRIPALTPVFPELCEDGGGRCLPTGECGGRKGGSHGDLDHFCAEADVCCVPKATASCTNAFTCNDGSCVARNVRCDGKPDCKDKSDEVGCPKVNRSCSPSEFTCSDGQCIDLRTRCDAADDCFDGSDEQGCGGGKSADAPFRCGSKGGDCTDRATCGRAPRDTNADCGKGQVCCIFLF